MTKFVCGVLFTCLILTMCINVLRKANQVEEPMNFQEIITYLGNVPHINNTVTDAIENAQRYLDLFANYFNKTGMLINYIQDEKADSTGIKWGALSYVEMLIRVWEEIVMAIEGLFIANIFAVNAVPLVVSILREFTYLGRIVVYICFGVPLLS